MLKIEHIRKNHEFFRNKFNDNALKQLVYMIRIIFLTWKIPIDYFFNYFNYFQLFFNSSTLQAHKGFGRIFKPRKALIEGHVLIGYVVIKMSVPMTYTTTSEATCSAAKNKFQKFSNIVYSKIFAHQSMRIVLYSLRNAEKLPAISISMRGKKTTQKFIDLS